jgi:hypothetical protein
MVSAVVCTDAGSASHRYTDPALLRVLQHARSKSLRVFLVDTLTDLAVAQVTPPLAASADDHREPCEPPFSPPTLALASLDSSRRALFDYFFRLSIRPHGRARGQ